MPWAGIKCIHHKSVRIERSDILGYDWPWAGIKCIQIWRKHSNRMYIRIFKWISQSMKVHSNCLDMKLRMETLDHISYIVKESQEGGARKP